MQLLLNIMTFKVFCMFVALYISLRLDQCQNIYTDNEENEIQMLYGAVWGEGKGQGKSRG